MDADLVAASPATVYRVLKQAGCFERWKGKEIEQRQGIRESSRRPMNTGTSTSAT